MADRLSLVVFSGTVDKLYPVAIMTSGAVALGQEVNIFLTFWGLMAFRKGAPAENRLVSPAYGPLGQEMMQAMAAKNVPSWLDMLREAKEVGEVRINACAMTMDVMGLRLEDLEPVVDGVVGVAEFLSTASEGRLTLFI